MKKVILIVFIFLISSTVWAQRTRVQEPSIQNLSIPENSIWHIITNDNRFLIYDYGYTPPPRNVIIRDLQTGNEIFSGWYYGWEGPEDIDLQGTTITIIKNTGKFNNGRWNLNRELSREETRFARDFRNNNKIPEDWIQYTDSMTVDLLLRIRYNFITREEKIIGGFYPIQQ